MSEQNISSAGSESTEPCRIQNSRSKISSEDKNRIIQSYEAGTDLKTVSQVLGVNYVSLKNVIYRYKKTGKISKGKIGGYRKKIINEEMGDQLLEEIDKKPHMTLEEMKLFLNLNGLTTSITTIASYLKNRFYTFKKLRYSTVEKNSDRVKNLRKDYIEKYMESAIRSKQCVYIDETYCNVWTQRLRGRSLIGENAYLQVPTQRGPNISILMAIGINGPIHFEVHQGSINQVIYQKFLVEVSYRLDASVYYFIHDNASIHNNVLTTTENHIVMNLPPYSPFLNPIENYFSHFKSKLRKFMTINLDRSKSSKYNQIKEAIGVIVDEDRTINLKAYYNKIKTYYPSCLLLKDIL